MFKTKTLLFVLFLATKLTYAQNKLATDIASLLSVDLKRYSLPAVDNFMSMEVKNNGKSQISSLEVSWSDGEIQNISTVKVNIPPGKTASFNHPIPVNFNTITEKKITAAILKVNNNLHRMSETSMKSLKFNTATKMGKRCVLFEQTTGSKFGLAARGIVSFKEMYELFPDSFIGVNIHYNDPMMHDDYARENMAHYTIDDIDEMSLGDNNKFVMDRWSKLTPHHSHFNKYEGFHKAFLKREVPIDLSATGYEITDSKLSITVKADFYAEYSNANFKLGVIVMENHVQGSGKGYEQWNYYADSDLGLGEIGGFEHKPDPIPSEDMVYDYVARELLGGYFGQKRSVPSVIKAGDSSEYTFEYRIPEGYRKEELHFVVFLSDETAEQSILNSNKFSVFDVLSTKNKSTVAMPEIKIHPNPVSDFLNINFKALNEDYMVTLYTAGGRTLLNKEYTKLDGEQHLSIPVSHLSKGNYLISIATSKASYSQVIVLK